VHDLLRSIFSCVFDVGYSDRYRSSMGYSVGHDWRVVNDWFSTGNGDSVEHGWRVVKDWFSTGNGDEVSQQRRFCPISTNAFVVVSFVERLKIEVENEQSDGAGIFIRLIVDKLSELLTDEIEGSKIFVGSVCVVVLVVADEWVVFVETLSLIAWLSKGQIPILLKEKKRY